MSRGLTALGSHRKRCRLWLSSFTAPEATSTIAIASARSTARTGAEGCDRKSALGKLRNLFCLSLDEEALALFSLCWITLILTAMFFRRLYENTFASNRSNRRQVSGRIVVHNGLFGSTGNTETLFHSLGRRSDGAAPSPSASPGQRGQQRYLTN